MGGGGGGFFKKGIRGETPSLFKQRCGKPVNQLSLPQVKEIKYYIDKVISNTIHYVLSNII